jgi:hypothetical protein
MSMAYLILYAMALKSIIPWFLPRHDKFIYTRSHMCYEVILNASTSIRADAFASKEFLKETQYLKGLTGSKLWTLSFTF